MRASGSGYVQPIKSDGTLAVAAGKRGYYTLTLGTTYYIPLGGGDAPLHSAHVQWDSGIVITTITVQDSNMLDSEVSYYSSTAGDWVSEDPTTAFVGTEGAGVTITNGVVAVAGGAAGGGMFHLADTGANRTRLEIVVGGTGGTIRVGRAGKQ